MRGGDVIILRQDCWEKTIKRGLRCIPLRCSITVQSKTLGTSSNFAQHQNSPINIRNFHLFRVLKCNYAYNAVPWGLNSENMPRALMQTHCDIVTTLLQTRARQSVIAKEANYSILQVKRIAKNIKFWRTRTPPKLKRQGRPPDIGAAMVQVRCFLWTPWLQKLTKIFVHGQG